MKCNTCNHNEVCKHRDNYISYTNMLNRECKNNTLYIECNFYEEIEKEPYEICTEYKITVNNGLYINTFTDLKELVEECKNQLRKGNVSYCCYETISYSDGTKKCKKLPY